MAPVCHFTCVAILCSHRLDAHTRYRHAGRQTELQLVRSGLGVTGGQIDSNRDITHSGCVLISFFFFAEIWKASVPSAVSFSPSSCLHERDFYTDTLLSLSVSPSLPLSLSCQYLNRDNHPSAPLQPEVYACMCAVWAVSLPCSSSLSHTWVQVKTRFR